MHRFRFLIFLLVLSVSNNLTAQDKFEKESRIKPKDVPSEAVSFIGSLNLNAKVKWYEEEGLDKKSIEAKFKHNKTNYSVEFDIHGNIEDAEIEVNGQEIPSEISGSITRQLQQDCSKHKTVKVQKQFTGSRNDLFNLLRDDISGKSIELRYEIVVKCHQQKAVNLFEYLFSEKGMLIRKSIIVLKNSSHLEY